MGTVIQLFSKVIIPLLGLLLVAVLLIKMMWDDSRERKQNRPHNPPSICDTCSHLARKGGEYPYRYRCHLKGSFNIAPIICESCDPKKGNDTNEQNSSSGSD